MPGDQNTAQSARYAIPPGVTVKESHALTTRFPIFLSSICTETIARPAQESELWAFRENIFTSIGMKNHVYVDEQLFDDQSRDAMATIDRLVPRIRDCDAFVCVLAPHRPGSGIRIEHAVSAVTFFEMELFQAALSVGRKPVYVYLLSDTDPSEEMHGILRLVKVAFPDHCIKGPLSAESIKDEIRGLVERIRPRGGVTDFLGAFLPTIGDRFVRTLDSMRAEKRPYSQLQMLHGQLVTGGPVQIGSAFDAVMKQIRTEPNAEKRLSRLWLAFRELMSKPYAATNEPEVLRQWEEVLRLWANAGAWYGLHGHTPVGTLAALNSAQDVNSRLKTFGLNVNDGDSQGALASAKYSIGRRLRGRQREALLREALHHATDDGAPTDSDLSGLRLVRASILMSMGQRRQGIEQFELALASREKSKTALPYEVGQAMSELGFAYLRAFRPLKGLEFCERSIPLLRTTDNQGHLARGLRKLCWAYRLNCRMNKAHSTYAEWASLVHDNGLYDQSP